MISSTIKPQVRRAAVVARPHVDKAVVALGMLSPMAATPQLYNVWVVRHTGGLSEVTYGVGFVMAVLWIIYGVLHRQRPIWMINSVWMVLHLSMVLGLLRYG